MGPYLFLIFIKFLLILFFFSLQLLGNILSWHRILASKMLHTLALEGLLNRYILLGLQTSPLNNEALQKCSSVMFLAFSASKYRTQSGWGGWHSLLASVKFSISTIAMIGILLKGVFFFVFFIFVFLNVCSIKTLIDHVRFDTPE